MAHVLRILGATLLVLGFTLPAATADGTNATLTGINVTASACCSFTGNCFVIRKPLVSQPVQLSCITKNWASILVATTNTDANGVVRFSLGADKLANVTLLPFAPLPCVLTIKLPAHPSCTILTSGILRAALLPTGNLTLPGVPSNNNVYATPWLPLPW